MTDDLKARLREIAKDAERETSNALWDYPEALRGAAARIEELEAERDAWRNQIGIIAAMVPIPRVITATQTIGDLVDWLTDRLKAAEAAEAARDQYAERVEELTAERDRFADRIDELVARIG